MKKGIIFITILIILSIGFRFKVGIYEDDEFAENHLFIKHRLTWKWKFYSPRALSDMTLDEMSEEKRQEQILFDEFVLKKGLSH